MDPNIIDMYNKSGACTSPVPPCTPQQQWIDPCSCDSYYFCLGIGAIPVIKQHCANGTAWKIPGESCDFDHNVHGIYCNPDNPLERCPKSTWDNFNHIVCPSSHPPTSTSTSTTPSSTQVPNVTADALTSDNSGLIAGIVVPSVVIILVVILVLILWRRGWKLPSKLTKPFQRKPETKPEPTETADDHIYSDIEFNMNVQPMPSPAFSKHSDGFAKGGASNSANHAGILPPPRIINRATRNDSGTAEYDNPGFDSCENYDELSHPRVEANNDDHQYTHLYADGEAKAGAQSVDNPYESRDNAVDGYYIIEKDDPSVI